MNDDLWDRVRGLGSKAWKGCERVELLVVLTCLIGVCAIKVDSVEGSCASCCDRKAFELTLMDGLHATLRILYNISLFALHLT